MLLYSILPMSCRLLQGVYAPGKIDKEQVISYKTKTGNLTNTLFSDFNTTLYQYRNAAQTPGALTRLNGDQWTSLNRTVGSAYAKSKSYVDPKKPTTGEAALYSAPQIWFSLLPASSQQCTPDLNLALYALQCHPPP